MTTDPGLGVNIPERPLEFRYETVSAAPTNEPGLVINAAGIVMVVTPAGRRVALWGTSYLPPTGPTSPCPNWPAVGNVLTLNESLVPIWRGAMVWP
jgi:hypothetical protein